MQLSVAMVRRLCQARTILFKQQQNLALAGLQGAAPFSEVIDDIKPEDPLIKSRRSRYIGYIERRLQQSLSLGRHERCSISCRYDPLILNHQNRGSLCSTGAMHCPFRNNEALPPRKLHSTIFQIDQQLALDNVEELVIVIVLMPVIFTLYYAKTNHGVVHLAQGLVIPLILGSIRKRLLIDNLQRSVQNVQPCFIRKSRIPR